MTRHIPRVYCPHLGDTFEMPEYQLNHMIRVMRMREGSQFIAYNEVDGEWLCEITKTAISRVTCAKRRKTREYAPTDRLALGICQVKPESMKLIIEKCTELGATDFYLLTSEYTNYRAEISKLKRIAIFASEQSGRLDVPSIHHEKSLASFVIDLPSEYIWYSAMEREEHALTILDIIPNKKAIGFIIGPEGGFSDAEKALLQRRTTPIRLSKNILRTETASILCIAIGALKHSDYKNLK